MGGRLATGSGQMSQSMVMKFFFFFFSPLFGASLGHEDVGS